MKFDFSGNIQRRGEDVLMSDNGNKPISMVDAITGALLAAPKQPLDMAGQLARYRLANKVDVSGSVELTPEEVTLIKQVVAENWGVLVSGFIGDFLERGHRDAVAA